MSGEFKFVYVWEEEGGHRYWDNKQWGTHQVRYVRYSDVVALQEDAINSVNDMKMRLDKAMTKLAEMGRDLNV